VLVKPTKIMVAEAIKTWLDGRRTSGRALSEAMRTASASCRTGSATFSFRRPPRHLDKLVTELLASGCRIATSSGRASAAGV
jgi:hypothetical protein